LTGDLRQARAELGQELGAAVCLAHPRSGPTGTDYAPRVLASRWDGELDTIVELVARHVELQPCTIGSRSRRAPVVSARRLFALIAVGLGYTNREAGLRVGVTESAVRQLCANATSAELTDARRLVALLTAAA